MNAGSGEQTARGPGSSWLDRLPARLRPRDVELPGLGQMRLVETTLLVLVGLVLLTATIYDVARQGRINHRLNADLETWRHYTGRDYTDISIDSSTLGLTAQREILCGNTGPGKPGATTQECLMIWGPTHNGTRHVHGGWYLPRETPDEPLARYGCFGYAAAEGFCPR